nr:4545_t:CDS:2 [Entrophospora candida]CAG8523809.1 3235_t:CDS:2 [Entrophospora candida]
MEYSLDQYFKETAPKDYQFLGYYQYRKSQKDFTNNFCLEARRLNKCLEYLVECGSTLEKQTAQRLHNDHRSKNIDINKFWNEIKCESLDIEYGKAKKCDSPYYDTGTEEGVGTIMRNVNMKLRTRIDYNEDDYNEDRISKRQEQDRHTTPLPRSPILRHSSNEDNPWNMRRMRIS